MRAYLEQLLAAAIVIVVAPLSAAEPDHPAIAEILEDKADDLLKALTNPWNDSGEGKVEEKDTFTGDKSIKIIPLQRYNNGLPGWNYRIVEKPQAGEYRYLRFAWKKSGGTGIMLQLHDTDWNMRYFAGQNVHGWQPAIQVTEKIPDDWVVVTRDLFKDFGERTLKGIALTAFDGEFAMFDHIYLGRTIEDLDRIDATGLRKDGATLKLTDEQFNRLWMDLASEKDKDAYWARWKLVAAPKLVVPFLKQKLVAPKDPIDAREISRWITELDHSEFTVREKATRHLDKHIVAAERMLRRELEKSSSPEAKRRIERLLAAVAKPAAEQVRMEKAVRILESVNSDESRRLLEELAKGADGARLTDEAKESLKRLSSRQK
jgi:hypothetical protein